MKKTQGQTDFFIWRRTRRGLGPSLAQITVRRTHRLSKPCMSFILSFLQGLPESLLLQRDLTTLICQLVLGGLAIVILKFDIQLIL